MARPPKAMAADEFVDDPAAEQLYDELFARGWSMHRFLPEAVPSPEAAHVQQALCRQALATVRRIRGGGRSATAACHQLSAVMWPGIDPPSKADPWWQTPLGTLLRQHFRTVTGHAA